MQYPLRLIYKTFCHLNPEDIQTDLYKELLATGLFEETEEKILHFWLEDNDLAPWQKVYKLILTKMDELLEQAGDWQWIQYDRQTSKQLCTITHII